MRAKSTTEFQRGITPKKALDIGMNFLDEFLHVWDEISKFNLDDLKMEEWMGRALERGQSRDKIKNIMESEVFSPQMAFNIDKDRYLLENAIPGADRAGWSLYKDKQIHVMIFFSEKLDLVLNTLEYSEILDEIYEMQKEYLLDEKQIAEQKAHEAQEKLEELKHKIKRLKNIGSVHEGFQNFERGKEPGESLELGEHRYKNYGDFVQKTCERLGLDADQFSRNRAGWIRDAEAWQIDEDRLNILDETPYDYRVSWWQDDMESWIDDNLEEEWEW